MTEVRKIWAEPEVRELDVRETFNDPGEGADVALSPNPVPDCMHS